MLRALGLNHNLQCIFYGKFSIILELPLIPVIRHYQIWQCTLKSPSRVSFMNFLQNTVKCVTLLDTCSSSNTERYISRERGDCSRAIPLLEKCISVEPNQERAYPLLADCLFSQNTTPPQPSEPPIHSVRFL